jgi:hypothetical protein
VFGSVRLELVSSDAAGNVSRRGYDVPVDGRRYSLLFPIGALAALCVLLNRVRARARA